MWDTKIKPTYRDAICWWIEGLIEVTVIVFSSYLSLKNYKKEKRRKLMPFFTVACAHRSST
jgi:hypothetical protein